MINNLVVSETALGKQTPIEIALKMDENGMVSAKHLYEWLELDPSHYARWCKLKIRHNQWAIENEDYIALAINGESNTPNPTQDYLLSVDFAKRIAMASRTKRGELARAYFQKCETALKVTVKQYNMLCERVEQLGALVTQYQSQIEDHNTRLALIDGGSKMVTTYQQKWVQETFEDIKKLAAVYTSGDWKSCISALIDDCRKYLDDSYNEYARAYRLKYPQEIHPYRLAVIAEFDEFREAFENALIEHMRHFGLINPPKENPLNAFYASMNVEEV